MTERSSRFWDAVRMERPAETFESKPDPNRTPIIATAYFLLVAIGIVAVVAVVATRPHRTAGPDDAVGPRSGAIGPTRFDHWHAALGVNDCGRWVPNWLTPVAPIGGTPVQAGTNDYAGLHSHGDGIIHMEPVSNRDEGRNATVGRYFTYAGFELSETSIDFVDVHDRNREPCDGQPGVLRWAVNGKEHHGDPADYKLFDGDVVELVFTTADAPLPAQNAVPSYATLREIIGVPI
jgi:hypothetical protein